MADIRLENIAKRYDNGFEAVRIDQLHIQDGEFLVLVGPSGCGKSTTLRMIAGLEEITEGNLYIGNRRVNDLEPGERDIAMVFQNYALYPHMSVRQNLSFGLRMRKESPELIDRRVREAAQILSIEDLLDRKPRELSGGQRQRVAVGRAIVRKPAAFLFDEPLSNLDAKLRVQMRTELARLHQTLKTTIVYVTHDQVEAMTLGDRIVVMKDSRIQQIDSPLNLYRCPANQFVASFIGSPAMNFVTGTLQNGCFVSPSKQVVYPIVQSQISHGQLPNGPCVFGFRPESVSLDPAYPKLASSEVDVIERMGHESMVYFEIDRQRCVARLTDESGLKPGDSLDIRLPKESWYLFHDEGACSTIAHGQNIIL